MKAPFTIQVTSDNIVANTVTISGADGDRASFTVPVEGNAYSGLQAMVPALTAFLNNLASQLAVQS